MCSTLHYKINDKDDIIKPSVGKVILNKNNNILYCSRTPIPVNKQGQIDTNTDYYSNVGLFVYDINYY